MALSDFQLFGKACRVVVGTTDLNGLDVDFKVDKSLKPTPNKLDLKIYGLPPDKRKSIVEGYSDIVSIEAGYRDPGTGEEHLSQIYVGEVRHAWNARSGPDWVTNISSGDGEMCHGQSRVSKTFGKGATPKAVLTELVQALGVIPGPGVPYKVAAARKLETDKGYSIALGPGNLDQAIAKLAPYADRFSQGCVLHGSASREMTRICRSLDLTWSIQGGKLQLLPIGKSLDGEAIVMSSDHGMIESPSIDSKGVLSFKCLMIPDVFPGRKVVMQALEIKGQYRIEETSHAGVSDGDTWGIDCKAKKY